MWDSSIIVFLSSLTPKFYVALTGTSSLISGLILIFEWCYYRKYGTSFIEHISLNHISPWLGGGSGGEATSAVSQTSTSSAIAGSSNRVGTGFGNSSNSSNLNNNDSGSSSAALNCSSSDANAIQAQPSVPECKVWRNPMSLFRGAEYQRFFWATGKEPLTYYDMNLSAQDHQNFFICESDVGKAEYEHMQNAWRERNPALRVKASKAALEINPDYVPAHILLAEEEASTIHEVEKIFKTALKLAESNYKKSHNSQHQNAQSESLHRRDTNILIYVKRRLGMCARKLGKLKDAVKIFRDLTKEMPSLMNGLNVHENLIEVLLELQAYADVQAVLAKYDDINLPKSATICYTAALLKARYVSEKFSAATASRRALTAVELAAIEAIHRAVEFNPHVPRYLLEMKPLIFPPEHVLKRGDSEAVSYAFFHQRHWKQLEGALNLLQCTWQGTFQLLPYPLEKGHLFYPYPACTECADRELLPAFHDVSVYPKKEIPFFIVFTAALCTFTALLAFLTHQFPDYMSSFAKLVLFGLSYPASFIVDAARTMSPLSFQLE